jgi:hypothetical protein
MGRKFSIFDYLKNKSDNFDKKKKAREPKWFFYNIYEDNFQPSTKEWIKRGFWNSLLFLNCVAWTIAISALGIRTFVFEVVKDVSQVYGVENQLLWMLYGVAFGIGGSLIFGTIQNPFASVHARLFTTLVYLGYLAFFYICLNIFMFILAIIILWF